MTGYKVNGRFYAALGAAINAAMVLGTNVMRGHQVVWTVPS